MHQIPFLASVHLSVRFEFDTNARQWIGQNLTHGQCKPQCMLTLSRHMFVCVGMGESCDCLLTGLIKNGHTRNFVVSVLPSTHCER